MKALLILVLVVPHPPRQLRAQAACKGEEEGVEVYSMSALSNGHVGDGSLKDRGSPASVLAGIELGASLCCKNPCLSVSSVDRLSSSVDAY